MHSRIKHQFSLLHVSLALAVFALLASCVLPTEPKAVAETFLKALQSQDYKLARSLADSDSAPKIIAVQNIASLLSPEDQAIITGIGPGTIEIKSVEEGEDLVLADWSLAGVRGAPLTLVKEAGLWRVRWQARSIYP